ncbi:MAG TPA: hypothetical protein VGO69_07980, partial [Pyrinomonadaceae bacterium]|nr:hypothetical protein [Pyrinomonadaceae bacterium]
GGGGGGKSLAEKLAEEAVKLAEIELKGFERISQVINNQLQRDITLRGSLIEADKKKQLAAEEHVYQAKLKVQTTKENETKLTKNPRERAIKEKEDLEERKQIEADHQEAVAKIEYDAGQKQIETKKKLLEEKFNITKDMLDAAAALVSSDESKRVTGAEATARKLANIALQEYGVERQILEGRMALYSENSEEYKRLSYELGRLESKRGALIRENNRNIEAGRREDLDNQRKYTQTVSQLEQESLSHRISIWRAGIERQLSLGLISKNLAAHLIQQQDEIEENARARREAADIRATRAAVDTATRSAADIADLDRLTKERLEQSETEHQQRLNEIRDRAYLENLGKLKSIAGQITQLLGAAFSQGMQGMLHQFSDFLKQLALKIVEAEAFKLLKNILTEPEIDPQTKEPTGRRQPKKGGITGAIASIIFGDQGKNDQSVATNNNTKATDRNTTALLDLSQTIRLTGGGIGGAGTSDSFAALLDNVFGGSLGNLSHEVGHSVETGTGSTTREVREGDKKTHGHLSGIERFGGLSVELLGQIAAGA